MTINVHLHIALFRIFTNFLCYSGTSFIVKNHYVLFYYRLTFWFEKSYFTVSSPSIQKSIKDKITENNTFLTKPTVCRKVTNLNRYFQWKPVLKYSFSFLFFLLMFTECFNFIWETTIRKTKLIWISNRFTYKMVNSEMNLWTNQSEYVPCATLICLYVVKKESLIVLFQVKAIKSVQKWIGQFHFYSWK